MDKLKQCRKARHLSQQQLADALEVSRSAVAMWETGGSSPDRAMILRLAAFFGVTTDYLLGYEKPGDVPPPPPTDEEIKFALFGGDGEITDAMYKEVQRFARMVKLREDYDRQQRAAQTSEEPADGE